MSKPSIGEILSKSGYTDYSGELIDRAVESLYANIGAGLDYRDWDAIMAADNPLEASEAALIAMYQDALYLKDNSDHLQGKYTGAMIEWTNRQIHERLDIEEDYDPSWADGSWMDDYAQMRDSEVYNQAQDDVPDTPAPAVEDKIELSAEDDEYSGGSDDEIIYGLDGSDKIFGADGDDKLYGGAGNDTLRGGAGVDEVYAGEGDDSIVVVGDLSGGGKEDSEEDTMVLGEPLSGLNGMDFNEDADGGAGIIDGGGGYNVLYVYGTADLSNYDISNVQKLEIRSDVILSTDQFNVLEDINGDGSSIVRIQNKGSEPAVVNLSDELSEEKLQNLGMIEVCENVTMEVSSSDVFGDASVLVGKGTVKSVSDQSFDLPETFSIESSLTVQNKDGSDATGNADVLDKVVSGKYGEDIVNDNGNNYLVGTDRSDTFILSGGGNDVVTARNGNDVFEISGTGIKTLFSTGGIETVDFSQASEAIDFDLTDGGTIGSDLTEVRFGTGGGTSGTYQEAPTNNVMLIMDVSGSMSGSNLADTKQAANDLFDAYENVGETAVRIVTFSSGASSSFSGADVWMDIDDARSVINGLSAYGGTDFQAAINKAMDAFDQGKGTTFLEGGNNSSYFLSDGKPNYGNGIGSSLQNAWEEFAIENQVVANAIGFDGISHTGPLEPISFDGTQLSETSQDRTAAQTDPLIEYDSTTLAETIVEQAKLDYIENITGTGFDDTITGNSLDNTIDFSPGGTNNVYHYTGGNDTVKGGNGTDKIIFTGNQQDWNPPVATNNGWLFTNGDQTVSVDKNFEEFEFDDGGFCMEWTQPDSDLLLQKYAPVMELHEDEVYIPTTVEAFLDHSVLWNRDGLNEPIAFGENIETGNTQDPLSWNHDLNDFSKLKLDQEEVAEISSNINSLEGENFLDFLNHDIGAGLGDDRTAGQDEEIFLDEDGNSLIFDPIDIQDQDEYGPAVYARAEEGQDGSLYLQYHFHWLYDSWVADHEGEWEFVQIKLNDDFMPELFMSSIHLEDSSVRVPWDENLEFLFSPASGEAEYKSGGDDLVEEFSIGDDNFYPVIYPGHEGHPTYFSAGTNTEVGPLLSDNHEGGGTLMYPEYDQNLNSFFESEDADADAYQLSIIEDDSLLSDFLELPITWGRNLDDLTPNNNPTTTPGTNTDNRWDNPDDWLWTTKDEGQPRNLYDSDDYEITDGKIELSGTVTSIPDGFNSDTFA